MAIEETKNSKNILGIIGFLLLIIAGIFAYLNFSSKQDENSMDRTSPASEAIALNNSNEVPATEAISLEASSSALVSEDILKEAVPENASLAKEEVAKLDDIQNQLKEQEELLKAQHSDADQLIKLKEEQIKLIEAQLTESK